MNFRPNKWKLIFSILFIVIWIVLPHITSQTVYCKLCEKKVCENGDYDKFMIVKPICDCACQTLSDALISDLRNTLLPFLLVYLIWSLFEKSK